MNRTPHKFKPKTAEEARESQIPANEKDFQQEKTGFFFPGYPSSSF